MSSFMQAVEVAKSISAWETSDVEPSVKLFSMLPVKMKGFCGT